MPAWGPHIHLWPPQKGGRAPALRLSSSSCVVLIDSLHLFFWSKRAGPRCMKIEGVCGVAQQTPTLDGGAAFCLSTLDGVSHTVILGQSALLYHHNHFSLEHGCWQWARGTQYVGLRAGWAQPLTLLVTLDQTHPLSGP